MTAFINGLAPTRWTSAKAPRLQGGHLFHPAVDFLCLGGGSLIVLSLLVLAVWTGTQLTTAVIVMGALPHVVNDPHFAHSYQIFYRNFFSKAFRRDYDPMLRARYVLAGVVVPIALILFFVVSLVRSDAVMLGYGANILLFFVGWHYVKQGYGMLMVDSVLKRQFFTDREKQYLLANAYGCWIFFWVLANWQISVRNLLGLKYYMFQFPDWVVFAAFSVAAVTTYLMLYTLISIYRTEGRRLLVSGTVAYLTTVYMWLFLQFMPLFLIFIPTFHSLQYLIVVWRYQINKDRARSEIDDAPKPEHGRGRWLTGGTSRFCRFIVFGLALGYLGFWGAPELLESVVSYDQEIFGGTLFFFLFWIFINVHHYFLDNVMWRRQNPDTRKYLFAHN